MTDVTIDPEHDLSLQRVIRASPSDVWRAWTEPARLEKWWIPAPMVSRVDRLDVTPGGGFVTRMSEDGEEFVPHVDSIFLVVEEGRVHQCGDERVAPRRPGAGRHDRGDHPR